MTGQTRSRPPAEEYLTQPITGGPAAASRRGSPAPLASALLASAPMSSGPASPRASVVDAVRRDEDFVALRRRQRRFVFTVTPLFLAWYGLFVGLSAFAPSFMAVPVLGSVNIGLLLGLAQFASTLGIVAAYRRFARREIDPRVRALRAAHEPGGPVVAEALTEIRSVR